MKNFNSKKPSSNPFASKKKAQALAAPTNPFEVHTNREKISIIGRRIKHDKGTPGISRSRATQKRKETLGREYLQKNKTNRFKDNRIGRFGMSTEDAANARFIAERLQQFKTKKNQSKFNLNENDDVLTHKGQTLEEIQQFHDTISDDDDDDEIGKLDAEFTGAAHFGGIDTDGKRKNAIDDLIADQKRRKAEISIEKEVVSNLTHKLDENWKDLVTLMSLQKDQNEDKPKPDDFDKALKEMVFERRGTVSDKLGTEEKVLKKEKAKLERLEKERIDRMHGITEEEKKAKHRSADDLDDGYFLEPAIQEQRTLAYNEDGKANRDDDDTDEELDRLIALSKNAQNANDVEEDEEGGSEEGSDEEGDEEEEESGDEDVFSDLIYESDSEAELNKSKEASLRKSTEKKSAEKKSSIAEAKKKAKAKVLTEEERKAMMEKAEKELPYTFELPYKYEALEKLLRKYSADYQAVILERMIKCNHPKVEPANRERMTTLFAYLLQYINDLAPGSDPVHCFTILDRISPFLYDLSHINPAETTKCFLEVIKEKQTEFRDKKEFPQLDTLVFLKIVSSLYSVSDFRHTIASPCVIFISQILTRSRVLNRSDITSGLFLVTVLLEYTQLSKRYLPAALNFLAGVLYLAIRKRSVHQLKVVPPFKSVGEASSLLVLKKATALDENRLLAKDLTEVAIDNSFKVRAFNTAVLLANHTLSNLDNCALQQLAMPFSKYLEKIDLKNYPEQCKKNVSALLKTIDKINSEPLTYLVPELRRPKALRQLEPKFERIFDDRRDRSKNAGNAAIRKGLQRKIKKETKGAVREIRRDTAFLAKVQHKRRMHGDAERKEKVRRIFSEASIQQGELNALDRKKKHM